MDSRRNQKRRPRSSGTEKPDLKVHFRVWEIVWVFWVYVGRCFFFSAYIEARASFHPPSAAVAEWRGRLLVPRHLSCAA